MILKNKHTYNGKPKPGVMRKAMLMVFWYDAVSLNSTNKLSCCAKLTAGTGITIALSTTYMYSGQVGGLCGNFDVNSSNDMVNLISGLQPSGTITEFTSRRKTVENCPDTDVPLNFDPCEVGERMNC